MFYCEFLYRCRRGERPNLQPLLIRESAGAIIEFLAFDQSAGISFPFVFIEMPVKTVEPRAKVRTVFEKAPGVR